MNLEHLSIKNKLIGIILLSTLFSLGVGFTLVMINDIKTFRKEAVDNATVIARVIADYSVVDLAFRDKEASTQTLSKLQAVAGIESACVYDAEGKVFAVYSREGVQFEPPPVHMPSSQFEGEFLKVFDRIAEKQRTYGTLYLCTSTKELTRKIREYVWTMLSIMASLLLLSFVLALKLQSLISRPVLGLAETARKITEGENYSIRVEEGGADEIGILRRAFNNMLGQIEKRQQERDQATEMLKRSETRFRRIVERSNDGLYVIQGKRFVFVNPRFQKYIGFSREELTSEDFDAMSIVAPESKREVMNRTEKRDSGEVLPDMYVFRAVSKSGVPIDFEANVSLIDWDGNSAILGILRDITERLRSEEQLHKQQEQLQLYAEELERSNRELDQFAYVTSHDLKAPLQAISSLSEWIEEDMGDKITGESKQHMDLLRKRVRRMVSLIEGVLEYSRAGRIKQKTERVDVAELLAEIVDFTQRPSGIQIVIGPEMPVFATDRVRLQQVFANLIDNAVKHHDRTEGKVEIHAQESGDFFEFRVSDDGPGIAPEYHEKIFVIFQTLKARDKFESTGVGLALVKKIVEDKGGRIVLESKAGEGATFRFTWPRFPNSEGI